MTLNKFSINFVQSKPTKMFPLLSPRERPTDISLFNEIQQVFSLFDLNTDGFITTEEIGVCLEKYLPEEQQVNQTELKKMIHLFDNKFSGGITFEQFAFFYAQIMGVPHRLIMSDEKLR
jgi:Ca2+-binding EF-hand superfamily protein